MTGPRWPNWWISISSVACTASSPSAWPARGPKILEQLREDLELLQAMGPEPDPVNQPAVEQPAASDPEESELTPSTPMGVGNAQPQDGA